MSKTVVVKELKSGMIQPLNLDHEPIAHEFSLIKFRSSFTSKINKIMEQIVEEICRK